MQSDKGRTPEERRIRSRTYEDCDTVGDVLEEAVEDLLKLSRINGMTEAQIDEALLRILAQRLEGEDDNFILEQLKVARVEVLERRFKLEG